MRDKFQKELEELNEEIIEMGKMIVYDIQNAVKALVTQDINLAKEKLAGWEPQIKLEEGLKKTIAYFEQKIDE